MTKVPVDYIKNITDGATSYKEIYFKKDVNADLL